MFVYNPTAARWRVNMWTRKVMRVKCNIFKVWTDIWYRHGPIHGGNDVFINYGLYIIPNTFIYFCSVVHFVLPRSFEYHSDFPVPPF